MFEYKEITDKYNNLKVWCIKKYSSSNFYLNQKIGNNLKNSKYQRTTKKWLKEIGVIS